MTVVILLFATTNIAQAFVIPSASMESTLLTGDHLLVDKLTYSPDGAVTKHLLPYREVRRGDVIVFRYPLNIKVDYVKRAIGIPGDHIKLVNKRLMLNGHFVDEPYAQHVAGFTEPYRDNFPSSPHSGLRPEAREMLQNHVVDGELVVPPNCIFAMGDNRENSDDSRFWGFVPMENIEGTPMVIYWSFDAPESDLSNGNIGFDHIVDVVAHFFTKTRWNRTFKLVHGYDLK